MNKSILEIHKTIEKRRGDILWGGTDSLSKGGNTCGTELIPDQAGGTCQDVGVSGYVALDKLGWVGMRVELGVSSSNDRVLARIGGHSWSCNKGEDINKENKHTLSIAQYKEKVNWGLG